VQFANSKKRSPPGARKLFIVTRYPVVGLSVTPFSLMVDGSIFEPTGAALSQVYVDPAETWRNRV
jgi:hypothetical protein